MSPDPAPSPSLPPPSADRPRSGKRGCLIAFAICAFLALAAVAALSLFCYLAVNVYTAPGPASVPEFSPTSADLHSAEIALKALRDATVRNEAKQIVLTERDLNTIIARDPGLQNLRGRIYLQITSSTMTMETSVPLAAAHLPGLSRRWLNLVVSFLLTYENNAFSIDVQSATANRVDLPESALKSFNRALTRDMNEKFHETLNGDLTLAGFWMQVKSIQIENGKVIVTTKGHS